MDRTAAPARVIRFGLFEVDVDHHSLARKGLRIRIQDQPLRTLILLLERSGEIVTREELRDKLWAQGTHVDFDGSLNVILKKLRAAIGDDSENPVFIETIPRRGYRFIAPVEYAPADGASSAAGQPAPSIPEAESAHAAPVPRLRFRWSWISAALAVSALAAVVVWLSWRGARIAAAAPKAIAALPFANQGAGPDLDYLRYAIASDLVTDLASTPALTVRPFASSAAYGSQPANLSAMGSQLRVTHVVTGGFLLDHNALRVTMELVDVAENRAVWAGEFTVSPEELVALHDKLAAQVAHGLLPAMNISNASAGRMSAPKNQQAFDLFMHSLSIPLDPQSNLLAIGKLEASVALDNSYAPAYGELGSRYYGDYHYGNGGEAAVAKALQAYKRQSELDPDWPSVSTFIRVEQGDLTGAYDQAADFLRRHPEMEQAHHAMSYVLRCAGLLDEANHECATALGLDPGFSGLRSCAMPYVLQGDYARGNALSHLDDYSGFGAMLRMVMALRTGDTATALQESTAASKGGFRFADLGHMYLSHAPEAQLRSAAADLETDPRSSRDPELLYFNAGILSYCRQRDAALRQLRKAIEGNYCSYPAMDQDPLFDSVRQGQKFAELRQAGVQCQQSFLSHRQQVDAKP